MIEEITICISIIIAIVTLYYNIRSKNKKIISINIALIIIIVIITMILNSSFISKCLSGYQFTAEERSNYKILNLGYSLTINNLYFIILWFVAILIIIVNGFIIIIKRKKNSNQVIKGIITIGLISFLQTFMAEISKGGSSIPDIYTEEMIAYEVATAKRLISLGIVNNIIATNLFILINFKNKKENVSDVKGENS